MDFEFDNINGWKIISTDVSPNWRATMRDYKKSEIQFENLRGAQNLPKWFAKHFKGFEFGVVLDVGASYGLWSNCFSRYFDTVICAEVLPPIRECLKHNTNHDSNITVLDFGLGLKEHEIVPIYWNYAGTGTASVHDWHRPDKRPESRIVNDCEIRSIDSVFPTEKIDFLKLDVESYELQVLRGAKNLLNDRSRCPEYIYAELLCNTGNAKILSLRTANFLGEMGYILIDNSPWKTEFLFRKY